VIFTVIYDRLLFLCYHVSFMQLISICFEGPWKKKNLHEMGIVTQCIAPSNKMNDQYFTYVLLKINAKVYIYQHLICGCTLFEQISYY
jgi:hypothetical protein